MLLVCLNAVPSFYHTKLPVILAISVVSNLCSVLICVLCGNGGLVGNTWWLGLHIRAESYPLQP